MPYYKINMRIILTAMIISLFTSCSVFENKNSISTANSEVATHSNNTVNDGQIRITQAKDRTEDLLKFKKFWNTEVLGKFNEQLLDKPTNKVDETYRFIWIPSFDNPIVIRIWQSDENQFLVVKKMNGQGFEMGKLTYERKRSLTKEEWLKFINLIEESSFWNLSTVDINEEPMPDGAYYAFEGKKNNRFHEVYRILPEKEIRELGAYLISLSELKTNYAEY